MHRHVFEWRDFRVEVQVHKYSRAIFFSRPGDESIDNHLAALYQYKKHFFNEQEPNKLAWSQAKFIFKELESRSPKDIGLLRDLALAVDRVKIYCDSGQTEFESWLNGAMGSSKLNQK